LRTPVSIALAVILVSNLLACITGICPAVEAKHDCCPKPATTAVCGYDILALAKPEVSAVPVASLPVAPVLVHPVEHAADSPVTAAGVDGRDLYILNRVLRI
jgi:hypothetical protein